MEVKLPTLKERIDAILKNKTPFDFMAKIGVMKKKECRCGKVAKYLFYDKLFKISPIIGLVCVRCKCDAEHAGHSGSGYETVLIKEIPKKEFNRVYNILRLSKLLIQISKPRQYKNVETKVLEMYGIDKNPSRYFKQRIKKHKKMVNAIYTILKYY